MNYKKILNIFRRNYTGFEFDEYDARDYQWDKYFGAVAETDLPNEFAHKILPNKVPEQGTTNSCVSCSFSWLQAFNSIQENNHNDHLLSWEYLWNSLDYRTSKGSTFRDNGDKMREFGTCLDQLYGKENADENALIYRIKNYSYVGLLDVKKAIYRMPIIVAVGGNNTDWKSLDKPIKSGKVKWIHAIVLYGWTKNDEMLFVNWWGGNRTYGTLEKGYPYFAMLSVEDIPDNIKDMKFYKTKDDATVWACSPKGKIAIKSAKDYFALTDDANFELVEVVEQDVLDEYPSVDEKLSCYAR